MTLLLLVILSFVGALALIVATPLWRAGRRGSAVALGVAAPLAGLIIYLQLGRPDAVSMAQDQRTGPPDVETMVAQLESRLERQPEDAEGWAMLGRSYVAMGRYGAGEAAWQRYLSLEGASADALANLAEAMVLGEPSRMQGEAGALFEQALDLSPDHPKALWYGGMSAYVRDDPQTALDRWLRLQQQAPPDTLAQVLETQIADARARLASATVDGDPQPAEGARVQVSVGLAEGAEPIGDLPVSSALFVYLRHPGAQGPPLAVRRLPPELPVSVTLSDADIMLSGSLPTDGQLEVVAHLAIRGSAGSRSPRDRVARATVTLEAGSASVSLALANPQP